MTSVRDRLGTHPRLHTLFQPVYHLQDGGPEDLPLFGLEALTRGPEGSDLHRAPDLFAAAVDLDDLAWLDWQALALAVERFAGLGLECRPRLMLNVNASTLELERHFPHQLLELVEGHGLEPSQVILEIIEKEAIRQPAALARAVHLLNRAGLDVALDDFGQGNANHRMILALRPRFLKLDRFLVRGIAFDEMRLALMASFALLARITGCRLVAEGIETPAQLATLQELGVGLGQGYLLGRPREPDDVRPCRASGGLCSHGNDPAERGCPAGAEGGGGGQLTVAKAARAVARRVPRASRSGASGSTSR